MLNLISVPYSTRKTFLNLHSFIFFYFFFNNTNWYQLVLRLALTIGRFTGFFNTTCLFFYNWNDAFLVKKNYRFNNLLHEAHGTGPKLPKGRREIRRGIKPRKFI